MEQKDSSSKKAIKPKKKKTPKKETPSSFLLRLILQSLKGN